MLAQTISDKRNTIPISRYSLTLLSLSISFIQLILILGFNSRKALIVVIHLYRSSGVFILFIEFLILRCVIQGLCSLGSELEGRRTAKASNNRAICFPSALWFKSSGATYWSDKRTENPWSSIWLSVQRSKHFVGFLVFTAIFEISDAVCK